MHVGAVVGYAGAVAGPRDLGPCRRDGGGVARIVAAGHPGGPDVHGMQEHAEHDRLQHRDALHRRSTVSRDHRGRQGEDEPC